MCLLNDQQLVVQNSEEKFLVLNPDGLSQSKPNDTWATIRKDEYECGHESVAFFSFNESIL